MLDASFWLAISFCIFVFLVYKPIKKALFKYLDNEIARVINSLSEAENLKKEAQEMVANLEQSIRKLDEERLAIVKIVEDQNKILIIDQQKELEAIMHRMEQDTLQRIEQISKDVHLEMRNILLDKSTKLAENYIAKHRTSFPDDKEIISSLF